MMDDKESVWVIGIDEAGYGPNLGPLVQAAVAVKIPGGFPLTNWWKPLECVVRRGKEKKSPNFLIDDSKEVFQATSRDEGMLRLEEALGFFGTQPSANLWQSLGPFLLETESPPQAEPWYDPQAPFPMVDWDPIRKQRVESFRLKTLESGLLNWNLAIRVVHPLRFNAIVEKAGTKAAVLLEGVEQFLNWGTPLIQPGESMNLVVDKLGGRDRYGPWLGSVTGGWISVLEESAAGSSYKITMPEKEISVRFEPKADQNHMTVALASMVAKYVRERSMDAFNQYWNKEIPGIEPTAGYPQDARRFLPLIEPSLEKLGIPMNVLWRSK